MFCHLRCQPFFNRTIFLKMFSVTFLILVLLLKTGKSLIFRDKVDACSNEICTKFRPVCRFEKYFKCCGESKNTRIRFVRKYGQVKFYKVKQVFLDVGEFGWRLISTPKIFSWSKFKGRLLKVETEKRHYLIRFYGKDESFESIHTRFAVSSRSFITFDPSFTSYKITSRFVFPSTSSSTAHNMSLSIFSMFAVSSGLRISSTSIVSSFNFPCISSISTPATNLSLVTTKINHSRVNIYLIILYIFFSSITVFILYFLIKEMVKLRRQNPDCKTTYIIHTNFQVNPLTSKL